MSKEGLIRVLGEALVNKELLEQIVNDKYAALKVTDDLDDKELEFLENEDTRSALKEFSEKLKIDYGYNEEKTGRRWDPFKRW
jgi:hypothetical protein